MLKLNFKHHLRCFKTGMIHDNCTKLEKSTAHEDVIRPQMKVELVECQQSATG